MEGERYLRTPEHVKEFLKYQQRLPVGGKNLVFKRWDKLEEHDNPEVAIFFATPDVLSGLFTLANFDQAQSQTQHSHPSGQDVHPSFIIRTSKP